MSILASRRAWFPVAFALLLLVPYALARVFWSPAVPGLGSQILELNDDVLTTYEAGATGGQDLKPGAVHRGVGVDGSLRAAPAQPMSLAGNPFGSPWGGKRALGGVDLASGAFTLNVVDIALPSEGPTWTIGRTYNSGQDDQGHTSEGYQGWNWSQPSQPEIVVHWDSGTVGTKSADDILYLVYGADRFAEFQRDGATGDTFVGVNGAAGVVVFTPGGVGYEAEDFYTYWDQEGYRFDFFGFSTYYGNADGQLWRMVDAAGNKAYIGQGGGEDISAAQGGYYNKQPLFAFDQEDRRYVYTYSSAPVRLTRVEVSAKESGIWGATGPNAPAGVQTVASVDYDVLPKM